MTRTWWGQWIALAVTAPLCLTACPAADEEAEDSGVVFDAGQDVVAASDVIGFEVASDGSMDGTEGGTDAAPADGQPSDLAEPDVAPPDGDVALDTLPEIGSDVVPELPLDVVGDLPPDIPPDLPPDIPPDIPVDTGPPPTGDVEGVVWLSDGTPVQGLPVRIIGQPFAQATTNFQGFFFIDGAIAGPVQLLAGPTGDNQARVVDGVIPADGKWNAGLITLQGMGAVEGHVDALGAAGQAGASVRIVGTAFETFSASSGYFFLPQVPAYCAILRVERSGFQPNEVEACVEIGATVDVGTVTLYGEGVCVPQCAGRACGDDGCGSTCGDCPNNQLCQGSQCFIGGECGNGVCDSDVGESCDSCPGECLCEGAEICAEDFGCCIPDCTSATCGDDGCGGSCGTCEGFQVCQGSVCIIDGGSCGNTVCQPTADEDCGTCAADCTCGEGQVCAVVAGTCCTPNCGANECGEDGCGGSCGDCGPQGLCVAGQCEFACPDVEPPAPQPAGLLPDPPQPGEATTVTSAGFNDTYLMSPGGAWKAAVRREWGGSLIYLGATDDGPGLSASNTLDVANASRGLIFQLRDVDRVSQGCGWNASCVTNPGAACPATPAFLGWSPRLGSNECSTLPAVNAASVESGTAEIITTPLYWNPDWERTDCSNDGCFAGQSAVPSDIRYAQRVRFVDESVVALEMSFTNTGSATHQETPHRIGWIHGASGYPSARASSGAPITPDVAQPDGTTIRDFESAGGWASLQTGTLGGGLAIMMENGNEAFRAISGDGAGQGLYARVPFGLAPGATATVRAYLLLGDFVAVAQRAGALRAQLPPFGALETPSPDQEISQTLVVSGWALDNVGVTKVELLIDDLPVEISRMTTGLERADVCTRFPGYADCDVSGFTASASLAGLSPCDHVVSVRATDGDGNSRVIGAARVRLAEGAACADEAQCEDGDPCTIDACDPLLSCVRGPKPDSQLGGEVCNNQDDDCDGETDEAPAAGCFEYFLDSDGDTVGTSEIACVCAPAYPYTALASGDCNDDDPAVFPGQIESCNEVNDDCDLETDEPGATGCTPWFQDADGDGWGEDPGECFCQTPGGAWTVNQGGDCDEDEALVSPGAVEACNFVDDNCRDGVDEGGVCPLGIHPVYTYYWNAVAGGDADHRLGTQADPPPPYALRGLPIALFDDGGAGLVPLAVAACLTCNDHLAYAGPAGPPPGYSAGVTVGHCASNWSPLTSRQLVRYVNAAAFDHAVVISDQADALIAAGYVYETDLCWIP